MRSSNFGEVELWYLACAPVLQAGRVGGGGGGVCVGGALAVHKHQHQTELRRIEMIGFRVDPKHA